MWRHYGSKVVGAFSRPFSEASGLITNVLWWYKHPSYGGLCPIYMSRELSFDGSIFMLWVSYFQYVCFGFLG
jgi:hypothetical protein